VAVAVDGNNSGVRRIRLKGERGAVEVVVADGTEITSVSSLIEWTLVQETEMG
jgi:hypothetical protein